MKLFDLYDSPAMWRLPFDLLLEREPEQNISHREMPAWEEHVAYMRARPHPHWYWFADDHPAGCVYLSDQREIGIGVLRASRGKGLGRAAVEEIMRLHPGRFLANINPRNYRSAGLFHSLGFELLQVTYAR